MIPDWLMIVIAVTLAIVLVLLAILLAQKLSWSWKDEVPKYPYEREQTVSEMYVRTEDMWEGVSSYIEKDWWVVAIDDFSGDLMGDRYVVTYRRETMDYYG